MGTVRKKNISGVDLEVPILGDQYLVKADTERDLPTHYPWHREPSGKPGADDYDPGNPAPIVWPEALWADAKTSKSAPTSNSGE